MKKKTNGLAIVGFVLSFITCIIGFIISIIASNMIDDKKERGRGLAKAGMIISSVKIIAIIILFILFANLNLSYVGDKCKIATNCELNESGTYTCTVINDDGVEEYIECDDDSSTNSESSVEDTGIDSEADTTDYDSEN